MLAFTLLIILSPAFLGRFTQGTELDLPNIVIEGTRYQRHNGSLRCDYKPTNPGKEQCITCTHKVDCAVECSLQTGDNKCGGFVSWANENGTYKRCALASEVTCSGALLPQSQDRASGERISYYRKIPIEKMPVSADPKSNVELNLGPRDSEAFIDAFDPKLCGNGSRRFLYDPYLQLAMGKIVGGADAVYAEFPFQVMLYFIFQESDRRKQALCGGSLIDREWVLTASHCFPPRLMNARTKSLSVHLGRHNMYSTDYYKTIDVKLDNTSIFMHPKYVDGAFHYDFTLIRLRPALTTYSTTIKPVCLNDGPAFNLAQKIVLTTGWGQLTSSNSFPDKLQKLPRRLMSGDECEKMLNAPKDFDPKLMLCTSMSGGRDQCVGDSGGPWATVEQPFGENVGSRWTLVGLTSWGRICGKAPGVGAKITQEIINWIKQTITNSYRAEPSIVQRMQNSGRTATVNSDGFSERSKPKTANASLTVSNSTLPVKKDSPTVETVIKTTNKLSADCENEDCYMEYYG